MSPQISRPATSRLLRRTLPASARRAAGGGGGLVPALATVLPNEFMLPALYVYAAL
jgi:hypothetical protein